MSRPKSFTPGPWMVITKRERDSQTFVIRAAATEDAPGPVIAETVEDHEGVNAEANAQLIAMAPRLLAICEEIANDSECNLVDSERRIRLYSAISKAGGKLDFVTRGVESEASVQTALSSSA